MGRQKAEPMNATRKMERSALEQLGVAGAALELVLKCTAPARHMARVNATVAAAMAAADGSAPQAAILVASDLVGQGGQRGWGALSAGWGMAQSARAPWAAGLGSGRWQAADGAAYRAAGQAAFLALAGGCQLGIAELDLPYCVGQGAIPGSLRNLLVGLLAQSLRAEGVSLPLDEDGELGGITAHPMWVGDVAAIAAKLNDAEQ